MENRTNVAELLKDCPKGMELDCTMFENVKFSHIDSGIYPIVILTGGSEETLTEHGHWDIKSTSKCVIFPKGKTTWEEFIPPCQFKDGDIVATNGGHWIGITKGGKNGVLIPTYCIIHDGIFEVYLNKKETWRFHRLATEEEKKKLFQAIKDNGYKWNPETKTLEKLVELKFKVGDKVRLKSKPNYVYTIHSLVWDDNKQLAYRFLPNNDKHLILVSLNTQDEYELVSNKFDITTLIPFESKVLVRAADNQFWRPAIWGVKQEDWDFCCVLGGEMWEQCIPYEGNEHLRGVADDCDEYYKVWK